MPFRKRELLPDSVQTEVEKETRLKADGAGWWLMEGMGSGGMGWFRPSPC